MDANRRLWNERQKMLIETLKKKYDHARAVELFMAQHAMLHAPDPGDAGEWSFDEELWRDLPAEKARWLPPGREHTIAWMIWHIARCEDITFNLLVARSPQVIDQNGWLAKVRSSVYDTGNAMDTAAVTHFSAVVDLDALRAYRMAVGQRTREIVRGLPAGDFQRQVTLNDIQRIRDAGAVAEGAEYLLDYWGKQKVAGLLLMPATRHLLVHLNEAMRVKAKRR